MSLYSEYIKERQGIDIVECEHGFATYKFVPGGCYIIDIYVRPELRRTGLATELGLKVVEIAKKHKVDTIIGTVSPSTHGSTDSLKALLSWGFELDNCKQDQIVLTKRV